MIDVDSQGPLLAAVAAVIDDVYGRIDQLRRVVLAAMPSQGAPTAADLSGIAPFVAGELTRSGTLIVGMGFIAEEGLVRSHPLRLDWWQLSTSTGEPTPLRVDLRSESLSFYDYPSAEWFTVPRESRRRHIVGPYVDVHGTSSYILTLTTPVLLEDRFLGVVGADLPLDRLETALLPPLVSAGDWAVVNGEGRVVLATSSRLVTGSRVDEALLRNGAPVPGVGWSLVSAPA